MTPDRRTRLLDMADTWSKGRYGDQGLRLRAEATAQLLRDAAAALAAPSPQPNEARIAAIQARYDGFDWSSHGNALKGQQAIKDISWLLAEIARLRAEHTALLSALQALRIDANRLCDRQLGGSYEDDCRRSIDAADGAIAKAKGEPYPPFRGTEVMDGDENRS